MREMLHIFITLNPKRIFNFFKLTLLEAKYSSYLWNSDVCYTTIPEYFYLTEEKIKSKLFWLVSLLVG